MKRSPLERRTPLKRTEFKRSPSRLRPRSAKAAADQRAFSAGARSVMCARCGRARATDGSHRGTRAQRPDLRGDPSNRDDLCRACHDWTEAHPIEAKAEGWRLAETYEAANADPLAKVRRQFGVA